MDRATRVNGDRVECNVEYCPEDCNTCGMFTYICNKLAYYENLKDGARLLDALEQVDEGYLLDWYISSVSDEDEPVWTEEHIKELHNDFIVIPRKIRLNEL